MPVDQPGIGNMYILPADDKLADKPQLKDETAIYFAGVKGVLESNRWTPDSNYTPVENGLATQTQQGNKFDNTGNDYLTHLMKSGSDINFVDQAQIGDVKQAQTNDFTNYDKYFQHTQP